MSFDFRIITGRSVHELIFADLRGCSAVVRDAYLAHHRGESVNPHSFFLRFPDRPSARIIGLPASLDAGFDVSGIKWIASYPENVAEGFPRASAVMFLNSRRTGYPYACLEASIISASRTAASAALAARAVHGQAEPASIGIVGTGLIARYVLDFLLAAGFGLPRVRLFDLSSERAARFAARTRQRPGEREVEVSASLEGLLRSSELVVFATTAPRPYVSDPALLAHHPTILHLSLRDLAPELLLRAHNIVDDVGHVMNADTSPHLAEKLTGGRDFVRGTIAGLLLGECEVDRSRPVIVSPFGLGVLDLAVAKWVHDRASACGDALPVPDLFFELEC